MKFTDSIVGLNEKKKISIRLDEKDSYDVTVSLLSAIPAYMEMNE